MQWFARVTVAIFFFPALVAAQTTVIKIPHPGSMEMDSPSYYPEALLGLLLDKTKVTYGDFRLEYTTEKHTADRLRAMLISGRGLDVMWSSVTPERKQKMRALAYDIFRGLHGYRRLVIRVEDTQKFKEIKTIAQLKAYQGGVGAQWADKIIFENNKLPLVAGTRIEFLLKMLKAGRFDYLSRSPYEYHYDLRVFNDNSLAIADNVMLYYCQPVNFFVNKNNNVLAERILLGLTLAQSDGSLEQLFQSVPSMQRAQTEVQQFTGALLQLENSFCNIN